MATTQNGIYYQDDYTKNADILADMQKMAESIDEVVQEEKENQETIEQKIQELQTEQTAQNKKIEQLDDNQIHITTEKSSNINVQDASGQNAKINVFGNSIQNGEPTPKAPVNIENVTGDIDITVCNKNLFNKDNFDEITGQFSNNVISTNNNEKVIYFKCKKNCTYTFQKKKGTTFNRFMIAETTEKPVIGTEYKNAINTSNTSYTYTTSDKAEYILWWYYCTGSDLSKAEVLNSMQIEENNVATELEENQEQSIVFPMKEGQVLRERDYTADDGIHCATTKVELDGTENIKIFNWSTPHEKTTMFSVSNIISKKTDSIKLCNYFKVVKNTVENLNKDEEYCLSDITGAIHFSISNEIATTVEQFKNWLAQKKQEGKSLIVEYDLLEEEIEEYTEEQQEAYNQLQNAKTYKTVTNVFTENAEIQMDYVAHTETYIDNEINSIKEQINTINELLSTTNTSALLLNNLQTDLESEVL